MEANQDQTIPEAGVLEDMAVALEEETQEMTESEDDPTMAKAETATAAAADGSTVKLKESNFLNYIKNKLCIKGSSY